MPYNMPNPTLDLPTKYGVLILTFLDPSGVPEHDQYGHKTDDHVKHVLRVEGVLTINRVTVRVCMRTYYGTRFHLSGNELAEQGERYMNDDHQCAYNRRVNELGQTVFGSELPAGVQKTLRALIETDIRAAYEAHPELQVEAQRARLAQAQDAAEAHRDAKLDEYETAERQLIDAQLAFVDFNGAHPMPEGVTNA